MTSSRLRIRIFRANSGTRARSLAGLSCIADSERLRCRIKTIPEGAFHVEAGGEGWLWKWHEKSGGSRIFQRWAPIRILPKTAWKQESIPVGCVPPAFLVPVRGGGYVTLRMPIPPEAEHKIEILWWPATHPSGWTYLTEPGKSYLHEVIIVRKRRCGKVMFSQACVKNSVQGGICPQQLDTPWANTPPRTDTPRANVPSANTPTGRHHPSRRLLQRMVRILLECILVTTRKRSLRQGNIFTPVCHSVHRGACVVAPGRGVWSKRLS